MDVSNSDKNLSLVNCHRPCLLIGSILDGFVVIYRRPIPRFRDDRPRQSPTTINRTLLFRWRRKGCCKLQRARNQRKRFCSQKISEMAQKCVNLSGTIGKSNLAMIVILDSSNAGGFHVFLGINRDDPHFVRNAYR